jgi:pimeloyl-ACP methyl ester carboxylesterase
VQDRVILHRAGYMLFRHPMLNKLNYQLMARSLLAVRLGLRGVFYSTRNMSDAFISTALAEVRRPNPGRAYDRFQRDELRWRGVRSCYYRRLHELTMPVQMIHGAKDLTVPVKWAERAVHAFPNATLSIIPKCGHMSHRDQPEQVLEPMMTFLKLRLR